LMDLGCVLKLSKIASMEDYGFWDFGCGRWLWYEMASQNGIMSLLEGLVGLYKLVL
jgi:hypothetical protein